jgi:uncharacterized protein (DUF302 family)
MADFTLSATTDASHETTLTRVRELLGEAGFGVLTEIDVAATLKTKLDVDVPPQVILGACRPQLAHQALQADPRIATMLPCNVVVTADGAATRVEVFDPAAMMSFSPHEKVAEVADEARGRLVRLLSALDDPTEDADAAHA